MKIAIIGKNSYIGQHCIQWLTEKEPDWEIAAVGAQNKEYKYYDFTGMDVIIHLAGLVHRGDIEDWNLYKQINVDLPVEVAQKAKKQKVKQFVFFSTMGVYGIGKKLAPNIIDEKTTPMPTSYYGKSKYLAEQELKKLEDKYGRAEKTNLSQKYKGPAECYKFKDMKGSIGFISPISGSFCSKCSRIRLTADGFLKLCLHYDIGLDIKSLLRTGADDKTIEEKIKEVLLRKPKGHSFGSLSENAENRKMIQIGG